MLESGCEFTVEPGRSHSSSTAHSKSRRSHQPDAARVTLVWLSPALPADRTELAASLPSDLALFSMPSLDDQAAIDGLAVESLCVATVFEPELLEKLATRPEGVRLLVVGPPDYPGPLPTPTVGRPPDAMSPTSSMTELAAAISQAASGNAHTAEMAAVVAAAPARSRLRSRFAAVGAVVAGLAIGGIVIGVTEGSSSASASNGLNGGPRGGFNGGQFPGGGTGGGQGGGQLPGGGTFNGGPGGGTANGPNGTGQNGTGQNGTGGRFDRGAIERQILTCLRSKGFTGSADQLRLRAADPQLRQAFATCIQQLGSASSQLSGRP